MLLYRLSALLTLFTFSGAQKASSSILSPNSLSFLKYRVSAPLARANSPLDVSVNSASIDDSVDSNSDKT